MSAPRVLLVDDDADFLYLTRFILEQAGFEVAAWDGGDVVDAARRSAADIAILDLRLDGDERSGVDLARRLQEMTPPRPLRVVVSGLDHPETHRTLREHGVARILLKPIDPETLVDSLRELLDEHEADEVSGQC